ncbi:hypothetical protein FISHEDRAFT_67974 [Fistulina hepatica ATCC 64428]|nr:hypothetical protein FISHEDRAFT_67974 [Fistulina hepatica ATCC 64428]
MPSRQELVAHGRDEAEIAEAIGADLVIFQKLSDLIASVRQFNPALMSFDCSVFTGVARESAWNGRTSLEASTPSYFMPYYVPPGAKSYDSASPLVHYSGTWKETFSSSYVHKSLRWTSEEGASAQLTFEGTGIECFGRTGRDHAVVKVFMDGKPLGTVHPYNDGDIPYKQQRIFWDFDLPYGKHTIKLVNTGFNPRSKSNFSQAIADIDAFVVTKGEDWSGYHDERDASSWTLTQKGSTGVHAMQLAVISPTHALVIDKVEHNPVTIDGHPAWAALYDLDTDAVTPLHMQSNSFCAGGTFLSNGTMINVGGNPVVADHTSAADFGDLDGLQAVRIFEPCLSGTEGCDMYENHGRIRMASPRWYNTVIRIHDGSAMIIGGSKKGGWMNNATVNNPTIEYFPSKSIHGSDGMPIPLKFLQDTLNANLFPIAFALPDGRIFMAANRDAVIYDWENNTEQRLPQFPNDVRVTYPMAATAVLLPMKPENEYAPEVLICGGSTIDDKKAGYEISSQDPSSAQCSRMLLTEDGIAAGWEVEQMPEARLMPDAVLLPTGDVLIVNGAGSGISGYGNVIKQVGASNADNPVLTPVLYKPSASPGSRFSSEGLPSSRIPRMYHSVATLTPNANIMIAGSNPNLDRSALKYGTEYRVEWLDPPYMNQQRPEIGSPVKQIDFGETFRLENVKLPTSANEIKVALMDLGFVTHAVHANSRLVWLSVSMSRMDELTITAPPSGKIYPPGPGWLYVVADGVPSKGMMTMVGDGKGPPTDKKAYENVQKHTAIDQYEKSKKSHKPQ